MKNQIVFILVGLLIVGGIIFASSYGGRTTTPAVDAEGRVNGQYSIDDVRSLGRPYKCTLTKSDATAQIEGTIYIDGSNTYADMHIVSSALKINMNSFLVINEGTAYTWTSTAPLGFKAPAAKSANTNASPSEQAQLIGTRDKENLVCEPWAVVDPTLFEAPGWITFTALNS